MYWYALRRLGQAVFVVWAAFTVTFVILYLMPSDPAELIAGAGSQNGGAATADQVAALRHDLGLDRPMVMQYLTHLADAVKGDWGRSYVSGQSVLSALGGALPPTLTVAGIAVALAIVFGLLLGFAATYARFQWLRGLLEALPSIGASIPTFWTGLMLMEAFSFKVKLFPAFGDSGFKSDVLPSVVLAIPAGATLAQVLIRSMEDQLTEPYAATARAKGASKLRVQLRHAGRVALLPVLTMLATLSGTLLAGTVVTETVFGRPGLGRLAVSSVSAEDLPVIQGIVIFAAGVFAVINLVADLVYPLVDPRVGRQHLGGRKRPAAPTVAATP